MNPKTTGIQTKNLLGQKKRRKNVRQALRLLLLVFPVFLFPVFLFPFFFLFGSHFLAPPLCFRCLLKPPSTALNVVVRQLSRI
jgi:hypothetical protein